MADFTVIANPRSSHQVSHQKAIVDGLKRHGLSVVMSQFAQSVQTKRVACWGWRMGKVLRASGHEVLVMERGYLGDRFAWTSLTWNGLNGRGFAPSVEHDGGKRFNANFSLKPMKSGGSYALIAGQVPGDAALQGKSLVPWYAEQARKDYGMPVKFRPHPLDRTNQKPVPGAETIKGDLCACLESAAMVITYNSNLAVDSWVNGVPAIAEDKGSMAFGVNSDTRERWAYDLAWRQWSMDEISSGFALSHLGINGG